jgi:hypothetical protein
LLSLRQDDREKGDRSRSVDSADDPKEDDGPSANGLLAVKMFDSRVSLIDCECRKNKFTEEGIELQRRKEGARLKSKASAKITGMFEDASAI